MTTCSLQESEGTASREARDRDPLIPALEHFALVPTQQGRQKMRMIHHGRSELQIPWCELEVQTGFLKATEHWKETLAARGLPFACSMACHFGLQ